MYTKIIKRQTNKKNKKKRISPSVVAFIGTSIILVGGFFLSYNYIMTKQVMAYDYMNNVFNSTGGAVTTEVEENLITEDASDKEVDYTSNSNLSDSNSLAAKANLVKQFNEKNSK